MILGKVLLSNLPKVLDLVFERSELAILEDENVLAILSLDIDVIKFDHIFMPLPRLQALSLDFVVASLRLLQKHLCDIRHLLRLILSRLLPLLLDVSILDAVLPVLQLDLECLRK